MLLLMTLEVATVTLRVASVEVGSKKKLGIDVRPG